MPTERSNLETARRYLKALEDGRDHDELTKFFDPNVVQEEFPNRLSEKGAKRDLKTLLEGNRRGREIMTSQRYDVQRAYTGGDTVVLEVSWTGTLGIPYGSIPPGGSMHAHFAVFLDIRDGKIIAQRNYDCFDPW